ncbi:MAG: hypothetical protein JWQ07_4650 [Ramlibacter sp.]|nr:hypothetical protein [Ramlibacter sp.]
MQIELLRSLTGSSFNAFFEGDLAGVNQARAVEWFRAHDIGAITIGWNVPIDQQTGAVVASASSIDFPGRQFVGSSIADVEAFARLCADNGLTVTLKPYFLNKDSAHNLSGFDSEWASANVNAVEAGMAGYLTSLAAAADRAGADCLVIGTENSNLAQSQNKAWWEATIHSVRAQFEGVIGYAEAAFPHAPSNPRDADNISFAASLDFVGVDLYAPVTFSNAPTYDEAVNGWTHNLKDYWIFKDANAPASLDLTAYLLGLHNLYGKPVMLSETGYPANDGAGINPMSLAGAVDVAEQDLLMRAELAVLGPLGDWFGGFLLFGDSGYQFSPGYETSGAALAFGSYGIEGRPAAATLTDFLANYQHPVIGSVGNDVLSDAAGLANSINGGAGIDLVEFAGARSQYTISSAFGRTLVSTGPTEVNVLKGVERLGFSDMKLAFDIAGNAGVVAKILGAVFGVASLGNQQYAGIGLSLADGGMSYQGLMQSALDARLGGHGSNTAVVDLLYTNVVGVAPSASERALYVGMLDSAAHTQASLGVLAADTGLNQAHINLVGLASTGIAFI